MLTWYKVKFFDSNSSWLTNLVEHCQIFVALDVDMEYIIQINVKWSHPPASKAGREVSNLTERKNQHTPIYGVKAFVHLCVCLSVCYKFDPNYLGTGRTEWAENFVSSQSHSYPPSCGLGFSLIWVTDPELHLTNFLLQSAQALIIPAPVALSIPQSFILDANWYWIVLQKVPQKCNILKNKK